MLAPYVDNSIPIRPRMYKSHNNFKERSLTVEADSHAE